LCLILLKINKLLLDNQCLCNFKNLSFPSSIRDLVNSMCFNHTRVNSHFNSVFSSYSFTSITGIGNNFISFSINRDRNTSPVIENSIICFIMSSYNSSFMVMIDYNPLFSNRIQTNSMEVNGLFSNIV
jgi:hypothetical protein